MSTTRYCACVHACDCALLLMVHCNLCVCILQAMNCLPSRVSPVLKLSVGQYRGSDGQYEHAVMLMTTTAISGTGRISRERRTYKPLPNSLRNG